MCDIIYVFNLKHMLDREMHTMTSTQEWENGKASGSERVHVCRHVNEIIYCVGSDLIKLSTSCVSALDNGTICSRLKSFPSYR